MEVRLTMTTIKKPKKQKLRNAEYYDLQATFDKLYLESKNGKTFTKIMPIILSENNIRLAYRNLKRNSGSKTAGTDNKTIKDLETWKEPDLVRYVRNRLEWYIPQPVRRVEIAKDNGKTRPLGIPTIQDRLIQQCFLQVLEPICEAKFHDRSFGFRPNRNCHQAVREIIEMVQYRKTNYVVEADIRGFFDNVDHKWLIKFLEYTIQDKHFIRYIGRFLKSGIMEQGKRIKTDQGTPQGGLISPILANVYLHYVLDLWIEKDIKKRYKGEVWLIRYADDFVVCFEYEKEAYKFYEELKERLKKFKLQLAEDKTKIIKFGKSNNRK